MTILTKESQGNETIDLIFPKKITLKKTFPAEFFSSQKAYIYIVEINDNDMTILTDLDLPMENDFSMKLFFNGDYGILNVRTEEKTQELNKIFRFVLSYEDVSPEAGIILANIATLYSVEKSIKFINPNTTFNIQIFTHDFDEWQCFYMFVLTLSCKGIEYSSDFMLPDRDFLLRMFLQKGGTPLQTTAKFLFEKNVGMGHKKGWLEFKNTSEENVNIIKQYMETHRQGNITAKLAEPIECFS